MMTDSTKKDEREATVAQTEALMDMIEGVFQAGYKAGKKETGLQMVIASDVIVPAAVEIIIDLVESAKAEAEIASLENLVAKIIPHDGNDNIRALIYDRLAILKAQQEEKR